MGVHTTFTFVSKLTMKEEDVISTIQALMDSHDLWP